MATGGGGGASRLPTWRERENNKRRERRRRAIAAKIFSGLRMYGNYNLPKHCDNNEVLRALCNQAGWIVEPDGTTYRKGCKPVEHVDAMGGSAPVSPCSSYNLSPCASYNPSPMSSSFPSPASSSYAANANVDGNSLIPWLQNLSSSSSSASSSKFQHQYMQTGSISAPVTSPLNSPARTPRFRTESGWNAPHYSSVPFSTPPSPGYQIFPNPDWFKGLRIPQSGPCSPTFSLVSPKPFGFTDEAQAGNGSRMWTPGQSGNCSPALAASMDQDANVPMDVSLSDEFAFGSNTKKQVKPWKGERIHEGFVSDDLELTLGTSQTR
ncbi:hypothetical protein ACET3Z_020502 [Daucus carota]